MSDNIHISRDGQELGILSLSDARDLLETGFLRETDCFWSEEGETPRPLSTLSVSQRKWLNRAKDSLDKFKQNLGVHARGTATKVSSIARTKKQSISHTTERLLEDYLPFLREQVACKLQESLHSAKSALNDDAFLQKLFGAAYDCLPKAVRRFVSEEAFVSFCLKHRGRLIEYPPASAAASQ